jgi:hypothetical protein
METITITFGDQAENHVGMEIIGNNLSNNSFIDSLDKIREYYGVEFETEHYDISQGIKPAELLIVKDYLKTHDNLMQTLKKLEWDKKSKMYGRVCNKKNRYNLIFADFEQVPDYEQGKGRVYNFDSIPELQNIRKDLERDLKEFSGTHIPIVAEGNYYYNSKCCINYHGDTERKLVLGLRLGSEMSILYQWYRGKDIYRGEMEFVLSPGDLYIMSSKSIGNDWKTAIRSKGKNRYALRHSAKFS